MAGPLRHAVAIAGSVALIALVIGEGTAGSASASTAPAGPRFTQTVDLVHASGQVFVTVAGKRTALTGAMQARLGATIDARNGSVRVISATPRPGVTHTAQFSGGQFELGQPRGEGGTLEVHLVGGNFGACKHGASATRYKANPIRRQLSTASGYPVHTSGWYGGGRGLGRRNSGLAVDAAAPTVKWDTVDRCSGTTVLVKSGRVQTDGGKVPLHFTLKPGESAQYNCSVQSTSYCAAIRSLDSTIAFNGTTANNPQDVLTLVTRSPLDTYDLTINAAHGEVTSLTYPLSSPMPDGYRRSDVTCIPDQGPGDYQVTWRIGTLNVPTLTYVAKHGSPYDTQCTSMPPGLGVPSGLSGDVPEPNIDVHYTTAEGDPTDAVSGVTAARVAQEAQSAFMYFTTDLGMPVNLGGAPIDIYIEGRLQKTEVIPLPPLPAPGDPAGAAIVLLPADAGNPLAVAGAVFGVLEDAIGRIDGTGLESPAFSDSIRYWAAANWAATTGVRATPTAALLDESLDCGLGCGSAALTGAWLFYQHLGEVFPGIVPQLLRTDAGLVRNQPGPQMDNALQSVLMANGSSLAHELARYALEDLGQAWLPPWPGSAGLSTDGAWFDTVTAGERLSGTHGVRHLAARYLELTVTLQYPCVNDLVTIDVTVPAGTGLAAADLAPGVTVESAGKFQTVLATSISATDQEVTLTLPSCSTTYVRVPIVNGTTNQAAPISFHITLSRKHAS